MIVILSYLLPVSLGALLISLFFGLRLHSRSVRDREMQRRLSEWHGRNQNAIQTR